MIDRLVHHAEVTPLTNNQDEQITNSPLLVQVRGLLATCWVDLASHNTNSPPLAKGPALRL